MFEENYTLVEFEGTPLFGFFVASIYNQDGGRVAEVYDIDSGQHMVDLMNHVAELKRKLKGYEDYYNG